MIYGSSRSGALYLNDRKMNKSKAIDQNNELANCLDVIDAIYKHP